MKGERQKVKSESRKTKECNGETARYLTAHLFYSTVYASSTVCASSTVYAPSTVYASWTEKRFRARLP